MIRLYDELPSNHHSCNSIAYVIGFFVGEWVEMRCDRCRSVWRIPWRREYARAHA